VSGLTVSVGCQTDANGTALGFTLDSATDATPTQSGMFTIALPPGPLFTGGPGAPSGEFARAMADLVYYTATGVVHVHLVAIANGTTNACSVHGVAVPAT